MGTKEAGEYLGITPRTLYRFLDAGEVPAYKLGRVLRVRRNDLDAYLESAKVRPGELRHLYPPRLGKAGGPAAEDYAPDPTVRCPACQQDVFLTRKGTMRKHNDADGSSCPARGLTVEQAQPD